MAERRNITSEDKLSAVVEHLKRINVVVLGDRKVGKSKLIESFTESRPFQSMTPSLLPVTLIPPGLSILDVSCKTEDRDDLIEKISRSHVAVVLYSADDPASLARVRSFWLPFCRSLAPQGSPRPVVLVCTKDDRRKEFWDEKEVPKILAEFQEVETFVATSAAERRNVTATFCYAVQAVVYRQLYRLVQGIEEGYRKTAEAQLLGWNAEKASLVSEANEAVAKRIGVCAEMQSLKERHATEAAELQERCKAEVQAKVGELEQLATKCQREAEETEKRHKEEMEASNKRTTEEWTAKMEDARVRGQKTLRAQAEDSHKQRIKIEVERDMAMGKLGRELAEQKETVARLTEEVERQKADLAKVTEQSEQKIHQLLQQHRRDLQEVSEQHEVEKETVKLSVEKKFLEDRREQKAVIEKETVSLLAGGKQIPPQQGSPAASASGPGPKDSRVLDLEARVKDLMAAADRKQTEYERMIGIRDDLKAKLEASKKEKEQLHERLKTEVGNAVKERETELLAANQRDLVAQRRLGDEALLRAREEYVREKESLLRQMRDTESKIRTEKDEKLNTLERDLLKKEQEISSLQDTIRFLKLDLSRAAAQQQQQRQLQSPK